MGSGGLFISVKDLKRFVQTLGSAWQLSQGLSISWLSPRIAALLAPETGTPNRVWDSQHLGWGRMHTLPVLALGPPCMQGTPRPWAVGGCTPSSPGTETPTCAGGSQPLVEDVQMYRGNSQSRGWRDASPFTPGSGSLF